MGDEEKGSVKEKLLQASGVQTAQESAEARLLQMERLHSSMMADCREALSNAKMAKETADRSLQELRKFCRDELPGEIRKAIDQVAVKGVRDSLRPLDEGIRKAEADLVALRQGLANLPLRGLVLPALLGLSLGTVGGMLTRCTLQ